MAKSAPNPKVEWYFTKATQWQSEFFALREIALGTGLEEELKWGHPCYTLDGKNVVLMHGFKAYCALLFHKGALLKDPEGLLVQQTANVQSARQLRFTSAAEITAKKALIKRTILEAAALERAGVAVPMKTTAQFDMPEELEAAFAESDALRKAFFALSPGRQRGYLLHFSSAKKSETRQARIAKEAKRILAGKGLDD